MAADRFSRIYARQEYLTPGEPETLDFIAEAIRSEGRSLVLEVASGKGEAACVLSTGTGCRIVAVEPHAPFLRYAGEKIAARGLADRVQLVRANGRQLPLPAATFDAGYCIGAPSIVGIEACLREFHRTVRPGGFVIVSDIVWRSVPAQPLGPEWGWLARETRWPSAGEYQSILEDCGLVVDRVHIHDRAAWDAYHQPMQQVAADERARGEAAFAQGVEDSVAVEQRGIDAFLDYATFITRNREE